MPHQCRKYGHLTVPKAFYAEPMRLSIYYSSLQHYKLYVIYNKNNTFTPSFNWDSFREHGIAEFKNTHAIFLFPNL